MENFLPEDIPAVYRGGISLKFRIHEVKQERVSGLLKTTHGISVDADASVVARFGGAYRISPFPVN